MLKNKFFFVLALLWTTLVTILSLVSIGSMGATIAIPNKDKIVHFIFYFVFVFLWSKATHTPIVKLMLIAVFFGIFMEFCQQFTQTRSPDSIDVLANILGATIATLFYKIIKKPFF